MPLGVSPLDTAQREGRLWTPLQLRASGNGMFMFCDTSELESLQGSVTNTLWRDMSGRGNHFTAGTLPPRTATFAGATQTYAIDFDGTFGTQTGSAVDSTAIFPDRQTGIVTVIMKYTSGTVQMKWENNGGSSRVGIETGNRVDWATDSGGKLEGWTEAITSTGFKICSIRRTTGGKTVRINGLQVASDTNTDLLNTGTSSAWAIGSDVGGSLQSVCSYKALIVTSHSDPLTEQRIEGYLAWQHGIRLAASHPYRDAPPTIGG